jgi:hypothetical protein
MFSTTWGVLRSRVCRWDITSIDNRLRRLEIRRRHASDEIALLSLRAIAHLVREERPDVAVVELGWCDEPALNRTPDTYFTTDGEPIEDTWLTPAHNRLNALIWRYCANLTNDHEDILGRFSTDLDEGGLFDNGEVHLYLDTVLEHCRPRRPWMVWK